MMTKEQLQKYLNGVIDDMRNLYVNTQQQCEELRKQADKDWAYFGTSLMKLTENQKAGAAAIAQDAVNKLMQDYREKIDQLMQEAENFIAEVKKAAVQDLVAAEPVPTDVQLRMVDQIKREYHQTGKNELNLVEVRKFENAMNYHVENGTVKAYPYYLAALEMFPEKANDDILDNIYKKLFPAVEEKKAVFAGIEECERFFKTSVICHKMDTISPETAVDQLEIIRMKQELAALGTIDKLNQRVITYVK